MSLIRTNGNQGQGSLISDLFNMGRFLDEFWGGRTFNNVPAVNIIENEGGFSLEVAAPGMQKEDFKISCENNVLTISSEKETDTKDEKENFTRREYSYNSFSRSFSLPESVNTDEVGAKYEDGVLKITLPKKETAKLPNKKSIEIK